MTCPVFAKRIGLIGGEAPPDESARRRAAARVAEGNSYEVMALERIAMIQYLRPIISKCKKPWFLRNPPIYYRYAQQHLPCECNLCSCPAQNGRRYSFAYINEGGRYIYYDVPKCASSTVRKELFRGDNDVSLADPKWPLNKYVKFSFVRNPWDRMVSNWKMFTTQAHRVQQLRSMTSKDLSSFVKFVHFARVTKNHHWLPQVAFLPDELDFLGRVESFDEDFNILCGLIGERPRVAGRLNATARSAYCEYYTPPLVELVADMFKEDIARFGYVFDGDSTPSVRVNALSLSRQ